MDLELRLAFIQELWLRGLASAPTFLYPSYQ